MRNCKIVFDTNAYRVFVNPASEEDTRLRMAHLLKLEKSRNIRALLMTDVAVELYSHLADLNDPDYNFCKNAVIAQYMHSLRDDVPGYMLNSDVHLCNLVFQQIPEFSYNEQVKILYMSQFLYDNSKPENLQEYTKNFNEVQKFSIQKKTEFVNKLKNFSDEISTRRTMIKTASPANIIKIQDELDTLKHELNSDISKIKLAKGILERAASTLKKDFKSLDENIIEEKTELIKTHFLIPIIFFRNILKSIMDSSGDFDFNDPKKGNLLWDYEMTFILNKYIEDENVIFVTNDKRFWTAVKEAGFNDSIMKVEDYLKAVGY